MKKTLRISLDIELSNLSEQQLENTGVILNPGETVESLFENFNHNIATAIIAKYLARNSELEEEFEARELYCNIGTVRVIGEPTYV